MIKLRDIIHEIQSVDSYRLHDRIVQVRNAVKKFFNQNKEQLAQFAKDDNWDEIYSLAFKNITQFNQDEVAQALGNEAMAAGWYTENPTPTFTVKAGKNKPQLDQTSDVNEINAVVDVWVKKNKKKLMKLADENNYKEFYQLIKDQFPLALEEKLVYAMNIAAINHDIHYEFMTEV